MANQTEEKQSLFGSNQRNLYLFLAVTAGMAEYYSVTVEGGIFALLQPLNIVKLFMVLFGTGEKGQGILPILFAMLAFGLGYVVIRVFQKIYQDFEGMRCQQTALMISIICYGAVGILGGQQGILPCFLLSIASGIVFFLAVGIAKEALKKLEAIGSFVLPYLIGLWFAHSIENMLHNMMILVCSVFLIVIYFMMGQNKQEA